MIEMSTAQKKVFDHISNHGEIEAVHLKSVGLDARAANKLVQGGALTLTHGVYRLKGRKKAIVAKAANTVEAPEDTAVEAPRKEKKARAPKAEKVAAPSGYCLCGCGAEVAAKRRFVLGHDAKLHSLVLRVFRGKSELVEIPDTAETAEYLVSAPWMTEEIREVLGL